MSWRVIHTLHQKNIGLLRLWKSLLYMVNTMKRSGVTYFPWTIVIYIWEPTSLTNMESQMNKNVYIWRRKNWETYLSNYFSNPYQENLGTYSKSHEIERFNSTKVNLSNLKRKYDHNVQRPTLFMESSRVEYEIKAHDGWNVR